VRTPHPTGAEERDAYWLVARHERTLTSAAIRSTI
jgi:hypothetical protein